MHLYLIFLATEFLPWVPEASLASLNMRELRIYVLHLKGERQPERALVAGTKKIDLTGLKTRREVVNSSTWEVFQIGHTIQLKPCLNNKLQSERF